MQASTAYKHSLKEVLSLPGIASKIKDTKAAREVEALQEFYTMLGSDPSRAFYGPGHVLAAAELGAIQTLLISGEEWEGKNGIREGDLRLWIQGEGEMMQKGAWLKEKDKRCILLPTNSRRCFLLPTKLCSPWLAEEAFHLLLEAFQTSPANQTSRVYGQGGGQDGGLCRENMLQRLLLLPCVGPQTPAGGTGGSSHIRY